MNREITTHEELAKLPQGSVILAATKNAAWRRGIGGWDCTKHDVQAKSGHLALPVTLLYTPEDAA